ncbi:hypothetical protein JOM56_003033 [Amanita muscaria]
MTSFLVSITQLPLSDRRSLLKKLMDTSPLRRWGFTFFLDVLVTLLTWEAIEHHGHLSISPVHPVLGSSLTYPRNPSWKTMLTLQFTPFSHLKRPIFATRSQRLIILTLMPPGLDAQQVLNEHDRFVEVDALPSTIDDGGLPESNPFDIG